MEWRRLELIYGTTLVHIDPYLCCVHCNGVVISVNGYICSVNGEWWFSGDNESGKTTLVSKLRGVEEQKIGSGLEYMYVTVKDEYGDGLFVFICWLYSIHSTSVLFNYFCWFIIILLLLLFLCIIRNVVVLCGVFYWFCSYHVPS